MTGVLCVELLVDAPGVEFSEDMARLADHIEDLERSNGVRVRRLGAHMRALGIRCIEQ